MKEASYYGTVFMLSYAHSRERFHSKFRLRDEKWKYCFLFLRLWDISCRKIWKWSWINIYLCISVIISSKKTRRVIECLMLMMLLLRSNATSTKLNKDRPRSWSRANGGGKIIENKKALNKTKNKHRTNDKLVQLTNELSKLIWHCADAKINYIY